MYPPLTYNAQGQLTQMVNDSSPNGLTRQWEYEPDSLSRLLAGKSSVDDRQKLTYGYDNNGNITSLLDTLNSGQKQCFQYDWLNRLTGAFTTSSSDTSCVGTGSVGVGGYTHSYGYNAIGNLTSYAGNSYTYGSKPHAVTGAFNNSYGYDANGNQTSRTINGVTATFTYDYENRLTAISGGATASFVYDADGNRVKSTVGGVTTVYIAGVFEFIENGATDKKTTYYDGNAMRRSGYGGYDGVFYLLRDHLNSSSVIMNSAGSVVANGNQYYFPYGGNRGAAFNDVTTKRFTGQYHESSLPGGEGLSYYNARWYDPKLGRFLSADTIVPGPANPQAFNRYSYVFNNPLKYTDPTGHTVRSALDQIRDLRVTIISIAQQYDLDPLLLAGVVFSENRNDMNLIRGQDWTSIFGFGGPEVKNILAPWLDHNPALGVTEVSLGIAAMMDDPSLLPANYGTMTYEERVGLQENIARQLSDEKRVAILHSLSNPEVSLTYTAKYLNFLRSYRDFGNNYELWLTEYNRGLSDWDTVLEYGERFGKYRSNIEHSLYFKEPSYPVCVGAIGSGACFDEIIYGKLPKE